MFKVNSRRSRGNLTAVVCVCHLNFKMIKKTAVLLVLGLVISINPGAVLAVEAANPTVIVSPTETLPTESGYVTSPSPSVSVTQSSLKDRSSEPRLVGLQIAWFNVSETISKLLARTEEQKAEAELHYIDKVERLKEKMANSDNPSKFESLLKKMEQKQLERMEKINLRMEKLGDKKDVFEQKLDQWETKKEERQQLIKRAKEVINNRSGRIESPTITGTVPSVTISVSPTNNPEMRGGNVRIDRPSTNRIEVR